MKRAASLIFHLFFLRPEEVASIFFYSEQSLVKKNSSLGFVALYKPDFYL